MYNGIGIGTPRGSGTSGYVQSNKFHLRGSRLNRVRSDHFVSVSFQSTVVSMRDKVTNFSCLVWMSAAGAAGHEGDDGRQIYASRA
jgi:hypothetical protein